MRIILRIILGLFLLFLVTGFIIIPLVLKWTIPKEGAKFLKHPVRLHSAAFNPFLLRLSLNDLEVLDNQNHIMVGLDKFLVQVNAGDLWKKVLHLEQVEIDGLKINAQLSPDHTINLLELIPPQEKAPVSNKPSVSPHQTGPLPVVLVDSIILHHGQVHFTDESIDPHFLTTVSNMELSIIHLATDPRSQTKIDFHAHLGDQGRLALHSVLEPLAQPLEMETAVSLNGYALKVLTPYVGKYAGRELKDGSLDLIVDYRLSANRLNASHRFLIQRFEFGSDVKSKDALHVPFGLAVALLEDSQGKIDLSLPVAGNTSDPKFEYFHLFGQVVRNFFVKLITKPFSFLSSALGNSESSSDELGYVRFSPGDAHLVHSQQRKLIQLIHGLKDHPHLSLEIDGSYDPQTDWKAMQAAVFARDYAKLRATSSRSDAKVYQMLYQSRFGIRALWALAKKYKHGVGDYDDKALDQEIKRQLIEKAPPDKQALSVLAQARAKLVYNYFLGHGFEAQRLNIGQPQETTSSMGYVPLEFTLTVFSKN